MRAQRPKHIINIQQTIETIRRPFRFYRFMNVYLFSMNAKLIMTQPLWNWKRKKKMTKKNRNRTLCEVSWIIQQAVRVVLSLASLRRYFLYSISKSTEICPRPMRRRRCPLSERQIFVNRRRRWSSLFAKSIRNKINFRDTEQFW